MASTPYLLLPLSLLLFTLTLSTARPFHPCNTLIVSTYSFSLQNPNPNNHRQFIFLSADLRPYHHHHHLRHRRFILNPSDKPSVTPDHLPLGFSSLKDRTKDILSVVASLLFGAACGALTAGTMYLVWSVFFYRGEAFRGLDGFNSDSDDNDDDLFNPKKKGGYVAIPAAPPAAKVVDDDVAVVAVPAGDEKVSA